MIEPSFPGSARERTSARLCLASSTVGRQSLPVVRSQAEPGNEKGTSMSSQTSRSFPAPVGPFLNENPHTLRMTAPPRRSRRTRGFWALFFAGLALNIAIVAVGASLFLAAGRTVEPSSAQRINVPFADKADVWKPLHSWVVQEDGRNKPFDT